MCALECLEYFADVRDMGTVNGWDTYEVRVFRHPCTAELDDDQCPLAPLEVLAGPVCVRGVHLPRIQKRAKGSLARLGWQTVTGWEWDGDDWLYWADVTRKDRPARLTAQLAYSIGPWHRKKGRDPLTEPLPRGSSGPDINGHRNTAEPSGELPAGDVVRVGGHWLAVARFGFTEVDWPTAFSLVPCWAGSNPLTDEQIPRRRWHLAWYGPRTLFPHHGTGADVRS